MEELMTILKDDNACLAEGKSEELISGIRTLFEKAGMMALGKVSISGQEFTVIRPAVEDDDAITSDYEYFSESIHGKAGVNKKTSLDPAGSLQPRYLARPILLRCYLQAVKHCLYIMALLTFL